MDNPQASVTDVELGWLVGILDGEGHISGYVHKTGVHYNPTIKFVNTNPRIVDKLVDILKRMNQSHYIFDAFRQANQKPAKRVEINGLLRVWSFINKIKGVDFAKKEECMALFEYINIRLTQPKRHPMTQRQQELMDFVRSRCKR